MGGFIGDIIESVSDAFEDVVDVVEKAVREVIEIVEDVGKFVGNVVEGTVENAIGMVKGAISGDWTEFRDGALGILTTAVAVSAIVFGAVLSLLNPLVGGLIMAAGIAALDAQHNEGQLLARVVHYAAEIETAVTGTTYIEQYAMEIQMLLTVAATITAGAFGGSALMDWSGLSAAILKWKDAIELIQFYGGIGYGTYQIYSAVASIRASQEYWAEQLREYEQQLREWISKAQAARNQWFDMMTDPNLINRIMPGGDLYSMGAGHDLWSVSSVAEPRYMLGLIDVSDAEMDRMINNRYNMQSAGSDGFKIN